MTSVPTTSAYHLATPSAEAGDGGDGLALDTFRGARTDVRRDDRVRQLEQRVIGLRRLLVEHVGAIAADLAGFERLGERDRGAEGEDVFRAIRLDDDWRGRCRHGHAEGKPRQHEG